MAVHSSDILPIVARKEELTNFLDRLELLMATVGTKASIFSELLAPTQSRVGPFDTYVRTKFRFATWCPT